MSRLIHLDTNILIRVVAPGSSEEAQLTKWVAARIPVEISSIVWGEFLCGPLEAGAEAAARRMFPHAIPLQRVDAERAASLFNLTGRRSRSFADCCIAAVAIRCGAELATSNQADFAPMAAHGLLLA